MRGSCRAQPSAEAKQTDLQKRSLHPATQPGLTRLPGAAGRGLDADCSDSQGEGQAASYHQGCYTQEAATRGGQDVSVARADRRSDIDMLAAGDMGSTTGADKQKSDG